jgi:hypothetical protein
MLDESDPGDDDFDLDYDSSELPVAQPINFDRFDNTFAELKYVVSCTCFEGRWARLPNGFRTFTTDEGATLTWCPKTKTIVFGGPADLAIELGTGVFDVVMRIALFGNRS